MMNIPRKVNMFISKHKFIEMCAHAWCSKEKRLSRENRAKIDGGYGSKELASTLCFSDNSLIWIACVYVALDCNGSNRTRVNATEKEHDRWAGKWNEDDTIDATF